jgi:hypothetical protein
MGMINWLGIIQDTLMITSFVIIMMLLIEFVNVITRGSLIKRLSKNLFIQVLFGTLLGIIPGCMGTFTAVSLYTHRLLSFGALVATMIATSGDEAYFMLALMPEKTLIMFSIMVVLSIVVGVVVDKIFKNKDFTNAHKFSFDVHETDLDSKPHKVFSIRNFNFTIKRSALIVLILGIMAATFVGFIGDSDSEKLIFSLPSKDKVEKVELSDVQPVSQHETAIPNSTGLEKNSESDSSEKGFDWVRFTIVISSLFALIVLVFSSEHFIEEHLWNHLIKNHLPKVLFWVFGTLILISVVLNFTNFGDWIYNNMFIVLIIAVLIGIIPQSGPHLVFVVLFIQGSIPMSILLASSIVQDGHGALPLLAESKKSFFIMKIINILVGLLVGVVGLLFNV